MGFSAYRTNYVSLTLNGTKLGAEVMSNFIKLDYSEDIEDYATSALTVSFYDPDFKIVDNPDITIGSTIVVVVGYDDDHGELFNGKISNVGLECNEELMKITTITAMDNSVALINNEEPDCFKDMTDNKTIEEIAKKVGLKVVKKTKADGKQTVRKIVQVPAGKNKLEVVGRLAKRNGNLAYVRGDTLYIQKWGDIEEKNYLLDYATGNYNVYSFGADIAANTGGASNKNGITVADIDKDDGETKKKEVKPDEKPQGTDWAVGSGITGYISDIGGGQP